jgi:hypothetical protein
MIGAERRIGNERPHLSYSRIDRYLHCPEQYRLYYVENLRPRLTSASLVFGQTVHEALALMFQEGVDPVKYFLDTWKGTKDGEINFGKRESWDKLNNCGQELLEKFVREQVPRISNVRAIEQSFEFKVSDLDLPFVGFIDLIADVDGLDTVIDFKTSGTSYAGHEAIMSDQLSAYQLAMPEAQRLGLCVLLKLKEPRIEWLRTYRDGPRLMEYLAKVKLVSREIKAGHFYKRPGKWCSWCDYLPVCLGDKQKVKQTLVRIK